MDLPVPKWSVFLRAMKYLLAWAVAPVFLIVLGEVGLRIAGYGHSTAPFIERRGGQLHVRNRAFVHQFLSWAIPVEGWEPSEFVVPAAKQENTYRIFVFGESAPEGWPDPTFSFVRFLNSMLQAQYPGVKFEIYNAAFRAVNSHAMRAEALAIAAFQPDLFIIYMGNNEVHGPFGLVTTADSAGTAPPLWVTRTHLALNDMRLVQLVNTLIYPSHSAYSQNARSRPLKPVYANDSRLPRIYRYYRENLEDICAVAEQAGAQVILSTVGVNLRHWRPVDSAHLKPVSEEDLSAWDDSFWQGRASQEAGDWRAALAAYEQAAQYDDTFAELHFREGECYWRLGEFEEAKAHFVRAWELDGFKWVRARREINEVIQATGARLASRGVHVVDTDRALKERAEHGCPGLDLFLDYCHFTPQGSYVLASGVFDEMARILPDGIQRESHGDPEPLSYEECTHRMGLSPAALIPFLINTITKDKFYDGDALAEVERKLAALKEAAGDTPSRRMQEAYEQALQLPGGDYLLRCAYVRGLLAESNSAKALEQARALVSDFPFRRASHRLLGIILARTGLPDAAISEFQQTVELYPDDLESYNEWIEILGQQGREKELPGVLRKALMYDDVRESRLCREGEILGLSGQAGKAEKAFLSSIKANPSFFRAYLKLDDLYAKYYDGAYRVSAWRTLAEDMKTFPRPFFHLGMALEAMNDQAGAISAYRKACENDPNDLAMKDHLNAAMERSLAKPSS